MQPMYKHDCKKCKFVGHLKLYNGQKADMYLMCGSNPCIRSPWYILRYSSEGPDYSCIDPVQLINKLSRKGTEHSRIALTKIQEIRLD